MKIDKNKLITCVLPKGSAYSLIEILRNEKKIITANMNTARGAGVSSGTSHRDGMAQAIEKDILTVLVPNESADELFEFIYEQANVNHPHGGFIYMGRILDGIPFLLPDVRDEA